VVDAESLESSSDLLAVVRSSPELLAAVNTLTV